MASEQAQELDPFGETKHPHQLRDQNGNARAVFPPFAAPPHGQRDQHVKYKCQGGESRNVQSVSAPRLLPVFEYNISFCTLYRRLHLGSACLPDDVALFEETGIVASPVAACPSGALVEELHASLQSSLDLALILVLNPGFPLVAHKPSGHKVVIIGVQSVLLPSLVLKSVQECLALKNLGPVSTSAARHARGSSVHVVSGRDLKVASLNVGCTKPVPALLDPRAIAFSTDTLAGANAANLLILKRSQNPGHQRRRPGNIVICHDDEASLDLRQGFAYLQALVGDAAAQNADIRR